MSKKSLLVVGILATCGAGAALWAAEGPQAGHRQRHAEWLKQEVGLSDAQIDQLHELRVQQRKAAMKRHADMGVGRLELIELLKATTVDEQAVRAKAKQLAALEASKVTARAEAGLALRKIVSGEQAEKLLGMRQGRRHRGTGPAGRRGPGRGPRGGRPDAGPGGPGGTGPAFLDEPSEGRGQ